MLQNNNMEKIRQVFFDYPTKQFQLREISRRTKIGLPSVVNYIKRLEKESFIKKEKKGIYPTYSANKNERFKLYKKTNLLIRLYESRLVDFLRDKLSPNVILLFGSASRGEDIETSDIDLFVLAKEERLNLTIFEKRLNRKINLLFEEKIEGIPKELLNNLINGIVLHGYFRLLK